MGPRPTGRGSPRNPFTLLFPSDCQRPPPESHLGSPILSHLGSPMGATQSTRSGLDMAQTLNVLEDKRISPFATRTVRSLIGAAQSG